MCATSHKCPIAPVVGGIFMYLYCLPHVVTCFQVEQYRKTLLYIEGPSNFVECLNTKYVTVAPRWLCDSLWKVFSIHTGNFEVLHDQFSLLKHASCAIK